MDTFRLFMAVTPKQNLECYHFDIKNTYTESHLKEETYLAPLKGVNVKQGHVLKALRSVYGLKQAGREWNLLLRGKLKEWGYTQRKADPCLYYDLKNKIWLLVYVDDIVASAVKKKINDYFYDQLTSRFTAKNLGEIAKVLGVRIIPDRKERSITLDQKQYLDAMLTKFGVPNGKYKDKKIPLADYNQIRPANDKDIMINVNEFQQWCGSFIYPMTITRPDICFSMGRLAQYMSKPAEHHGHAAKGAMGYLRSTIKQKLHYGPGKIHEEYIAGYTDADWISRIKKVSLEE
jgi:hypothetical protein